MDEIAGAPQLDRDNPWPGLMPFSEAAQEFFHGREDSAAELARRVRRDLLTVLFGKSGLGKTSLLNAGLFPRLRAGDFLPVYLRLDFANPDRAPRDQIAAALADNLARDQVDGPALPPGATLWGFFHDKQTEFWSRRNRLVTPVLVLDQFEETFTLGRDSVAARELVAELAALIENRPPDAVREALEREPESAAHYDFAKEGCKVVIALREDFLPELEGLQRQIPSIMVNRMRLTPMNGRQAREVILRSGGHLVDEAVAERIIAFVSTSHERMAVPVSEMPLERLEIEPALLSIVCRELNTKRQRAGRDKITADLLEGAQEEIVADFYNSCLEGLGPGVKEFIEDHLLTSAGYRDSAAMMDILLLPGLSREAIDTLIGRRLLRIEERFGVQFVELTHDLLTEVIRKQRDARRETQEAEAQRERAERAEAEAAAQAALAREAAERERAAHRLVRRTRIALAATAVTLALAIFAIGGFFFAIREAKTAQQLTHQSAELAEQRAADAAKQKELADQRTEEAMQNYKLALDAATRDLDLVANNYKTGGISLSLAKTLLDAARTTFGGLPEAREGTPSKRARVRLFYNIADLYRTLGDLAASLAAARQAQTLAEQLPEESGERNSRVAYAHDRQGLVLRDQGNLTDAIVQYRAVLELMQKLAGGDPNDPEWQQGEALAHQRIGEIFEDRGELDKALVEFRADLDTTQHLADADPGNTEHQHDLEICHEKIGDVLRLRDDPDAALTEYHAEFDILQHLAERQPRNLVWQFALEICHEKLGGALRAQGDRDLKLSSAGDATIKQRADDEYAGALKEFRAEDDILVRLTSGDPSNPQLQRGLAIAHEKIGDVLAKQKDDKGSAAEYRAEFEIVQKLATQDPTNARWQGDLMHSYERMGSVAYNQEDYPAALTAYQKAQGLAQRLKEINPTAVDIQHDLDWLDGMLARTRGHLTAKP